MRLNEFCEYSRNPLAEVKARVVLIPPDESWITLRRFYQVDGAVELRLSDLVNEGAWLPMPSEVFERLRKAMFEQLEKHCVFLLIGMPGYLSLLTDENKQAAIMALREWIDDLSGVETVCFLRSDDGTGLILKDVFSNPRYRQGKQLIEIASENAEAYLDMTRAKVMLVDDKLTAFIPEACVTFQKYLRYTEEHPIDNSPKRIVVASGGREIAGLNTEVRQVVSLRDLGREFYGVDDESLAEYTLQWMCELGKCGAEKTLLETLMERFFPTGEILQRVLRVFNERKEPEAEAFLWLVKQIAPRNSYLEYIVKDDDVTVSNFRSAYVVKASKCLECHAVYAKERTAAISEAGINQCHTDIQQFIAYCKERPLFLVAPWMTCGTDIERSELLRRCAKECSVAQVIKDVYPELGSYLSDESIYGDETLENYFKDYRELKITGNLTSEFYEKAQKAIPPDSMQTRDVMVQRYAADKECALLVVDAMGAEWLPMLIALAKKNSIGVEFAELGEAVLPTSTEFNSIFWPDSSRRLREIKKFDNIVHNGVEAHETRSAEDNLVAALKVLRDEVLLRVADGLTQFARVLVTADHGSSRLAMLAWTSEQKLAKTLDCEACKEICDWRYCIPAKNMKCPPELEETLSGEHWVVRGYNRMPKKGGGNSFELHGGATLEERLVPVVVFSRSGKFMPQSQADTTAGRAQIIEKDDFDL